jgi:hypothetical protein
LPPSSDSAPSKVERFRATRPLIGVALTAIAIAGLFALLERQVLPRALRQLVAERGVEVGRVDVSLMRQEVSIGDLALTSPAGSPLRSLRCGSLLATIRLADLARGRVVFPQLTVSQPSLEVGSTDPESAGLSSTGTPERRSLPRWPLRIHRVTILDARVHVRRPEARDVDAHFPAIAATDLKLPGAAVELPWHLANRRVERSRVLVSRGEEEPLSLSLSVRASKATPDAAFPIEAELVRDDATLTLSGMLHLAERRLDGSISASQVELAPLLARIDRRVPVTGGRVSGRLALSATREADAGYAIHLTPVAKRRAERAIDVDDLELEILGESRHSVSSSEVSAVVEAIRISGLPGSPHIDAGLGRVDLAHPRIEIVRPLSSRSGPPPGTSPRIRIASRAVQIEDGFVAFLDETTAPPFRGRWSHVNGRLDAFSWPRLRIDQLALEASGVGGDPVRISGKVSPAGTELSIEGRRDSLVRYSPHVAARTGLEVVGGTGAVNSSVHIDEAGVRTAADFVLSRLELKSGDPVLSRARLAKMPLPVALALLTDSRGDITIHLDLAFDRQKNRLDWLSLLAAGLQRSLTRTATAPLRLVGALTSSEAALETPATWLGFVPGRASLSEESRHRVHILAELLSDRPELAIRLYPTAAQADLATPERRTDSDLDDEQWLAELGTRRTLAIGSLLQDEYALPPERVRTGAQEFAPLHAKPGVAIALEAGFAPETPELPGFAEPGQDRPPPAVSAPPE